MTREEDKMRGNREEKEKNAKKGKWTNTRRKRKRTHTSGQTGSWTAGSRTKGEKKRTSV